MLDPTEGVAHSRVGRTFLRRNLAKDVDVNAVVSDDRQELRIDVTTYRIIFTYNGIPGRPFVYEKKFSESEMASAEKSLSQARAQREEKMKEKFVRKTGWMKDVGEEEIRRREAAWQQGLEQGLWKMDQSLKQENSPTTVAANVNANANANVESAAS